MGYANEVLRDEPYAYYRLDDADSVMRDFSGNGTDGRHGSSTPDTGLVLGSTAARRYDGTLAQQSLAGVAINSFTEYTIEAFVKITTSSESRFLSADMSSTSPVQRGLIIRRVSGGQIDWYWNAYTSVYSLRSATAHPVGSTLHVGAVAGADGRRELWINGVLEASKTSTITAGSFIANKLLAVGYADSGNAGAAVVDELAVYSRPLSADRIKAHYAARDAAYDPALDPPKTRQGTLSPLGVIPI